MFIFSPFNHQRLTFLLIIKFIQAKNCFFSVIKYISPVVTSTIMLAITAYIIHSPQPFIIYFPSRKNNVLCSSPHPIQPVAPQIFFFIDKHRFIDANSLARGRFAGRHIMNSLCNPLCVYHLALGENVVIIWSHILILPWHPHQFSTAGNLLHWTSQHSYRVDLSWCVYHLIHTRHPYGLIILYPLDHPFALKSHFHQNNFIYCRGRSLLMICSFISIIFNNHPHLFVKLVHLLSLSPYTTPEKWAYHLPSPSTPNSPRKITFSLIPHFRPLSYIPHEKWGYHHLWTSTQNFRRNIGFLEGVKGRFIGQ